MRRVVVDTSALIRLFVPDGPVPDGLEAAVEAAWRGDAVLLAPQLAWVECAQVLRKKELRGQLAGDEVDRILAAVAHLPLEWVGHGPLVPAAVEAARATGLTVYDAVFLVLAHVNGAALMTGDRELAAAFAGGQG